MTADLVVVYDACVLYPLVLRGLLLDLANSGLFAARWTDRIHDEWIAAVLRNNPALKPSSLTKTRRLMDLHVPGCLVNGYESLIDTIRLPDPDDRHVLAAAVHAGAQLIVTHNTADFPARHLTPLGVRAVRPDAFVSTLVRADPARALEAARVSRADLRSPPVGRVEFLRALEKQGMDRTCAWLRAQGESW